MQFARQYMVLLLAVAVICSSQFLSTLGNATENATRLSTPVQNKPIQDNLVNPAACRHCRSTTCTCEPVCCPKNVIGTEEKSCWKVACEYVCVPGFRFPWDKCCGPVCGWVRRVNVLEEHKYECETCGYEWEVKCVCTNQGHSRKHSKCPRCQRDCR
ncbi:hypothetical protein [Bythopirellula polymerisocia]|uniref:hypothetical protein n=1 Tax=Bythopirellula polymerisocia TaxID=2528003 RepID=UPI0011B6C805|nr:hypothetical protein [Bythopirellula polymerisocia]